MNFAWSLKPIFIWIFAIFGIDLDKSKQKAGWPLYLSISLCLFWILCLKIPFYSARIYEGLMYDNFGRTSFVFKINFKMIWILSGVLHISFSISMIGSYFGKWKSVWEKMQQLQYAIGDDGAFYRQLRREITAGLAVILVVFMFCSYYW